MRTFVMSMVALLVWDLFVKLWRLYSGNTNYPGWALVGDSIVAVVLAGWGIWVLASA